MNLVPSKLCNQYKDVKHHVQSTWWKLRIFNSILTQKYNSLSLRDRIHDLSLYVRLIYIKTTAKKHDEQIFIDFTNFNKVKEVMIKQELYTSEISRSS